MDHKKFLLSFGITKLKKTIIFITTQKGKNKVSCSVNPKQKYRTISLLQLFPVVNRLKRNIFISADVSWHFFNKEGLRASVPNSFERHIRIGKLQKNGKLWNGIPLFQRQLNLGLLDLVFSRGTIVLFLEAFPII